MWTLLLWLNQKIVAGYEWLKSTYKVQKAKRMMKKQMMLARHLPAYLRRDMGLPPYTENKNTQPKDLP
ncbi:hypothetical protein C0J08_22565 [Marinomonas sp. CT5]|uniref:hypothetical protein n=1 Tax=Marinomonas sp. CT5 TaxID=2066133 RepID=UPI0018370C93|nr:hypothetical protein [Marinomonas sp. CT5]NVK73819.1 hypothetical protein [Oceanospirillaceae bacterium]QUX98028.1 hypothetical protein C0J08_22565 [Marinomonas sp. CT5]